jgi:hypothetical protein
MVADGVVSERQWLDHGSALKTGWEEVKGFSSLMLKQERVEALHLGG